MAEGFTNDNLAFACIVAKAEILSLLSLLEVVCERLGIEDPEGLTLDQRFYQHRKLELEKLFRDLEDSNPGLAAKLHGQYEAARDQLGEDRS